MTQHIKQLLSSGIFAPLALFILFSGSCSKMDSTYEDFIQDGSIIYTGAPDSVYVMPGNQRLTLRLVLSDKTATRAQIYWNNKRDSATYDLHQQAKEDLVFSQLAEGNYSFDIYLYDAQGHRSIKTSVVAMVYGDDYTSTLLSRSIRSAVYENNTTTVPWGASDETMLGATIHYTDQSGTEHELYSPREETSIELADFDFENHPTFSYRTSYLPDTLAIDTFYTAYENHSAQGPPIEYDRSNWVASGDDYDGTRMPKNMLDGDTKSVWHMNKGHGYPHEFMVDMQEELLVEGFTYTQRTPLDGAAKLVEIFVSHNGTSWQSLGPYTFENSDKKQYLDLLEPATFRYFKMIFKSDYKSGNFTALAEIGTYKR